MSHHPTWPDNRRRNTVPPSRHGCAHPADRHILQEKSGQAACGSFTMAAQGA